MTCAMALRTATLSTGFFLTLNDDVADLGAGTVDDLDALVGSLLSASRSVGERLRYATSTSPCSIASFSAEACSKYWTMKFGVCALFGPL